MNSTLSMKGDLSIKVIRAAKPNLSWRLRRTLRWAFIWGWFCFHLAKLFSQITGIVTMTSVLEGLLIRADGTKIKLGVLSYRVITDTGVAFIVDDWDTGATEIANLNFHGCGTGTAAENQTDAALQTECTTVLNPDSTRATGTKSQPTANQLRSIGTLTFDGSASVTEHGILSQAATGGGVLWDRSVFSGSPISVTNGDSIQFTYTVTLNANG